MGDRVIGAALDGKPAQVIGDPDQPHSYTYKGEVDRCGLAEPLDHLASRRRW